MIEKFNKYIEESYGVCSSISKNNGYHTVYVIK